MTKEDVNLGRVLFVSIAWDISPTVIVSCRDFVPSVYDTAGGKTTFAVVSSSGKILLLMANETRPAFRVNVTKSGSKSDRVGCCDSLVYSSVSKVLIDLAWLMSDKCERWKSFNKSTSSGDNWFKLNCMSFNILT